MKTYLTFLFLIASMIMLGQDRPELFTYNPINIELKSGGTLNGIGKLNLIGELVYRKNEDADKRKMETGEVNSFKISKNSISRNFFYKNIDGPNTIGNPFVLELIETGKINLYKREETRSVSMGPGMGSMPQHFVLYYIGNPGEDNAEYVKANTYSRKFRKNAARRFPDCPVLVKKIQDKGFERYSIQEIVKFYNSDCK